MSIAPVRVIGAVFFERALNMVCMFRCMIKDLTHWTEEGTTNDEASSHLGGSV